MEQQYAANNIKIAKQQWKLESITDGQTECWARDTRDTCLKREEDGRRGDEKSGV